MYVDDILVILMNATAILKSIRRRYCEIEYDKIEPPEMYLGAKLKECDGADGISICTKSDGTLGLDQATRDFPKNRLRK